MNKGDVVICCTKYYQDCVTIGREYKVEDIEGKFIFIVNDFGRKDVQLSHKFIIKSVVNG